MPDEHKFVWSPDDYLPNEGAGSEVSSTYEGRHVRLREDRLVHPFHLVQTAGLVRKGDPIICREIVGVSFNTAAATSDFVEIDTEGIWNLLVYGVGDTGNVPVHYGDLIYIHRTLAVLSRITDCDDYHPFGFALGAVAQGEARVIAVKVHSFPCYPAPSPVPTPTPSPSPTVSPGR